MRNRWVFLSLLLYIQCSVLFAYEGDVHKKINEEATNASQIDTILKNQLGLYEGLETKLNGFKDVYLDGKKIEFVWQWIGYGGKTEDFGKHEGIKSPLALFDIQEVMSTRAHNHFHDPLKNWSDSGLSNIILNKIYHDEYGRDSVSSIIWGLNPGQQDFQMNTTGDWSWGKAKENYYIYLTGRDLNGDLAAENEDKRIAHFADCFRALGQVMHLLEDMSVPLHTRNDAHILPWTYI